MTTTPPPSPLTTPPALFPILFAHLPPRALEGIPVYLRTGDAPSFTLYASAETPLTIEHRRRLSQLHVHFLYIPATHQYQFHRQIEDQLDAIASDESLTPAAKSEIIYDASVELMSELLENPSLQGTESRLLNIARHITKLALQDHHAFSRQFAVTHHDAYTAAHLVNVGAWMVPLAISLGTTDPDELAAICLSGLLHDIGKVFVKRELLTKTEKLTAEDIAELARHPQLGADYLRQFPAFRGLVATVALQHHERLDGTGYPHRLFTPDIDPVSRMCAVVDSFDAMTALRPYKQSTRTAAATVDILHNETPLKFERAVVGAWTNLVAEAAETVPQIAATPLDPPAQFGTRRFGRRRIHCPASIQILTKQGDTWVAAPTRTATVHNISPDGMALMTDSAVHLGDYVRITLLGGGDVRRVMDGLIVRCRPHPDGQHDIGLRLVDLLTEARTLSAEDVLFVRNQ